MKDSYPLGPGLSRRGLRDDAGHLTGFMLTLKTGEGNRRSLAMSGRGKGAMSGPGKGEFKVAHYSIFCIVFMFNGGSPSS